MNSTRTVLLFAALSVGCTSEQGLSPLVDLGDSDSARPSIDMTLDMARGDLSFKPGWNQVIVSSGLRLNAVWASGPGDIYAVGLQGTIFHSTGDDVWTQQKTGRTNELTSVFGSSDHDVYAVEASAVLHTTGDGHWTVVPNIPAEGFSTLQQVWMSSPSNIYFSGATGQSVPANRTGGTNIMRWNQAALTPEYAAAEHQVSGFWGTDSTDLWAVGNFAQGGASSGMVLHSTGDGSWAADPDLAAAKLQQFPLYGIWGSRFGDVYIVGQAGIILHKRE